ncbi:MAG: glycosyltransferase family 2 protein [Prevotellaceae bacterium]|nr:glycosyltransferase family 2 protein [Prevotellaceae bacterium]
MLDLSVIILTYNEEIHIRRCIENVNQFARKVYVVDCYSTDSTVEIAKELGAEVVQHEWPGNQAEQFNWALDNIDIQTEWILRLDADEYLQPKLIMELQQALPYVGDSVSAFSLSRARAFQGRILHHGIVNNIRIIRIFRRGMARYEKRLMDEHLSVLSGEIISLKHQFVDDNIMSIGQFTEKHNGYASREAALLLDAEYNLTDHRAATQTHGADVQKKRVQKARYTRMPLFWRAFGYFLYRYIFKLGFLDGKEGFMWDFLQGWWYRTLVDIKIYEIKKACGNDKEKIKTYLQKHYQITL